MISEVEFEDYVVLDFETSGLSPTRNRVLQVGLLRVRDGVVTGAPTSFLVNPMFPVAYDVPEHITEITGISSEAVSRDGVSTVSALSRLFEFVGDDVVWAHNGILFDRLFLNAECYRNNKPIFDERRWLDSAALFKAWRLGVLRQLYEHDLFFTFAVDVLGRRVKGLKYNLQHCCRTLNISEPDGIGFCAKAPDEYLGIQWHDAAVDVLATHWIVQRMRKIMEAL